jgi:hypothetical protein
MVVVELAVRESGDPPDGNPAATCASRQLSALIVWIGRRQFLGHAPAARDGHIRHGQVAIDGQHSRWIRFAAGPGQSNAGGKSRGVDDDAFSRVERRPSVVSVEVTQQVRHRSAWLFPDAHDLALQRRVLFADDGQLNGAAVEAWVEDDGLAAGRRGQGGTKRNRFLGRQLDVFETVDDDRFMVDGAADNDHGHWKSCQ